MQIKSCRICGNEKFNSIMNLGDQVLTGRFPKDPDENITIGPLSIVQCDMSHGCGLVQLEYTYDVNEMYGDTYGYRSGLNKSMIEHLGAHIENILECNLLSEGDIVLDIGSNDGTALGFYPKGKYELIGIDPAAKKYARYYRDDIIQIHDFFTADKFSSKFPKRRAKVITSFSMFYDLEEPVEFAKDVSSILESDGVWCFEQSYMPAMLEAKSFDTICHEHIEFYGLTQIVNILDRVDMHVLDVSFNDVNGGSFLIFAGKKNGPHAINTSKIEALLLKESQEDYASGAPFSKFRREVELERRALMTFLKNANKEGKTVVGLGASTKGNVLLQYYGITQDLVSSIAEVNPDKYSCYTPGTKIPIRPQSEVLEEYPDYFLVLPWHFRAFFESMPELRGRTLVFPLPTFEVVTIDA